MHQKWIMRKRASVLRKLTFAALLAIDIAPFTMKAHAGQLVSNGESVFTTSESDTFTNFTTYDLTFNTSSASSLLYLNLSSGSAALPVLNVEQGGLIMNGPGSVQINGGVLVSNGPLSNNEMYVPALTGTLTLNSALGDSPDASLSLYMSGSGTLVLNNTSAANTISGGINLQHGVVQISNDLNLGGDPGNTDGLNFAGGELEVTSSINFSPTRVFSLYENSTFYTDAGTMSTISGSNQLVSGASGFTLTKDGTGTLILGASNTFSSAVVIKNGTLQLNDLNSLGAVGAKGTITLNSGALNLRTDGPFVKDANGNYSASFGNNIVASGANTTIDIGGTTNTGPAIDNIQLGALSFPVNGTLNITNSTSSTGATRSLEFTGTTTIGNGGQNSSNITINNTPDVRFGGPLTGNGSLTKTGPGALYLSGTAPNTYANYTNVSGGTLVLDKSNATNAVPGDLTITGGTVVLMTSGQIIDSSDVQVNGGTLNINSQSNIINALNNSGGTVETGSGNLSVTSPDTTALVSGTTIVNPGGTLSSEHLVVQGGYNEAQPGGTFQVGSGSLGIDFQSQASLNQSGPTIILDNGTSSTGEMLLTGPLNFTASVGSSGSGSLQNNGSSGGPGVLDLSHGTRVFTIGQFSSGLQTASSVNMIISASITDGAIDKEGTGVLLLSGSNTYSGGTNVGTGTLQVSNPSGLGTGPVTFGTGILDLRTDASTSVMNVPLSVTGSSVIALNVDRITTGLPGTFTVQITGNVSLGAGGMTVTGNSNGSIGLTGPVTLTGTPVFSNVTGLALDGSISGAYGITASGTGLFTLGGTLNNTYTGTTSVYTGTLFLDKSSATAIPGALTIATGTVMLGASEQISSVATLTFNSQTTPGTFNLNNFTETIGSLVDGGVGSRIQLGSMGTGKFNFGGSDLNNETIAEVVSGSGLLVKNGNTTYTFTGANTYTGGATVNAGTLAFTQVPSQVTGLNTLTGGTWTVYSGATLTLPSSVNITTNQGTIVLNGSSPSFNAIGNLSVNSGTLTITNGNVLSKSIFSNTGVLNVGGGVASSFTVSTTLTQYSTSSLSGGTWNTLAGGSITIPAGDSITTLLPGASVNLSGGSFSAVAGLATNQGTFTVSGESFITAGNFSNTGTLNVGGSSTSSVFTVTGTLTQLSGSTLTAGTINILANGSLILNSGTITTIGPSATFSGPLSTITGNQGNLTIGGTSSLTLPAGLANDGNFNVASGTSLTLTGGLTNASGTQGSAGTTSIPAGASLLTNFIRQSRLTLGGTATIRATSQGGAVSIVQNLNISGGLLDLANSDLIVRNTSLGVVTSQLAAGYNLAGGGNWNGTTGITSATARNDTTHLTTLGIMPNTNGGGIPIYTSFDGQTVTSSDILVKFTYYGDLNLDGRVDGSDYSRIDIGYLSHLTGWSNGDLNYDGVINGSDYTLMDNAYNRQGVSLAFGYNPVSYSGPAFYLKLDNTSTLVDVYSNATASGTPTQLTLSTVSVFNITGTGSSSSLTVDFSNGNPVPSSGVSYTGATGGTNTLKIIAPAGSNVVNVGGNGVTVSSPYSATISFSNTSTIIFAGNGTGDVLNQLAQPGGGATLVFSNMTSNDTLNVSGGTFSFQASTGTGITPQNLGNLLVGSGAKVTDPSAALEANRYVLVLNSLTIAGTTNAWTGQLDLGGNDLVIHNGSLATVTNLVKSGYNLSGGATFTGLGVDSSLAAGNTSYLTTLGVILNTVNGTTPLYANFDNLFSTLATDVLVKYTYYGDANLDGKVDGSDYSLIDNGYLHNLTGWYNGDFNYDGVINGSDYTLIDNTYDRQGARLSDELAGPDAVATVQLSGSPASVPEPTSLGVIAIAGLSLLRRRRGSRR